MALEELRVYGHFNKLTDVISTLPSDVFKLTLLVLTRIVGEDDDTQKVLVH